jgi:5-enolpyruvylshikimate-3-phosphate synthase
MTEKWWEAPASTGPIDSTVLLPGSKSETARALMLRARREAANVSGSLKILHALKARDTELMLSALEPGKQTVDCGLAGTVMRFVPAIAAFRPGQTVFDGDDAARKRPLAPLMNALESLGATIQYLGEPGYLPLRVTGVERPTKEDVELDSSGSSQFLSALLLACPSPLRIHLTQNIPSLPHVELTAQMLRQQGINAGKISPRSWFTTGGVPDASPITIAPDLSNAGPFLAAALICGGKVTVPHWPAVTEQAGDAWQWILPHFGATVKKDDSNLTVSHNGRPWNGVHLNLREVGELTPTVAALATLGDSQTVLSGIGHLRGHETDRLEALKTEIIRAGGNAEVTSDSLIITPGNLHAADFHSYGDHRMATFGACLALALPGSRIIDIETTSKTLPDFTIRWEAMLAGVPSPTPEELDLG